MNDLMAKVAALSVNRIAIFGLLLTVVYYFMFYNNGDLINAEIQTLTAQIAEETSKKVETEKILKKEEEMRADVASLAKTYEAVKSKIPIEFESSELRTMIEQISAATDLKVIKLSSTVDFGTSTDEASSVDANLVQKVAIAYTFQGNYGQIQEFMTQIAAIEKVIKVSELKIRSEAGQNGPSKYLTVDAIVVGYKQAAVAAKPATGAPAENTGEIK